MLGSICGEALSIYVRTVASMKPICSDLSVGGKKEEAASGGGVEGEMKGANGGELSVEEEYNLDEYSTSESEGEGE